MDAMSNNHNPPNNGEAGEGEGGCRDQARGSREDDKAARAADGAGAAGAGAGAGGGPAASSGQQRAPARVRFGHRPPGTFRRRVREAGWRYDPVAAVWHLPEDPERWPAAVAVLDEAEASGRSFERLAAT